MKLIQNNILDYLDDDSNTDKKIQNLFKILNDQKIHDDKHVLVSVFHLVVKISKNRYRCPNFFNKIDVILNMFKDDLKIKFSNAEIFRIFRSNKRILLFLVEEKILILNEIIFNTHYPVHYFQHYFSSEFKKLLELHNVPYELPDNFYEDRKTGENNEYLCKLIRNDSINEFTEYFNNTRYKSFDKIIAPSIYETNSLILKQYKKSYKMYKINLIEYAAFFGSIHIFQYLINEGVKLTPSLWLYAIHGKNLEIIHLLESNNIEPEDKSYKECLKESIKCFNNEIIKYIIEKYFNNKEEIVNITFNQGLKSYNFDFIKEDLINESSFYNLCKYDYYSLLDNILKEKDFDMNKLVIFNYYYLIQNTNPM